jgi:L-ascorbate metabolism protein UlaG (beta-lactamase superfamily)
VPIHWGTFDALTGTPEALEAELRDQGVTCQVVRLDPGQSW